jgi:glycerol kinase
MQFQADISGRRIERARVQNLSALGVAHLAAMSVGLWSLQDMEELARPTDDYEPRSPADLRDQHRAGWLDAVRRARLS